MHCFPSDNLLIDQIFVHRFLQIELLAMMLYIIYIEFSEKLWPFSVSPSYKSRVCLMLVAFLLLSGSSRIALLHSSAMVSIT